MTTSTEAVLERHLQAAKDGVDGFMRDFAEESVVITQEATYRGLGEIRKFYTAFVDGLPNGFWEATKINRQEVVGEVAYILWEAKPWLLFATDTLVVRNDKILFQTYSAYTA